MPAGKPSSSFFFTCPHCDALYQIVKCEAGPESVLKFPCRQMTSFVAARDEGRPALMSEVNGLGGTSSPGMGPPEPLSSLASLLMGTFTGNSKRERCLGFSSSHRIYLNGRG
jgi:hypothetical protein